MQSNYPCLEIFRDLPETMNDKPFRAGAGGIRIEETTDDELDIPSFDNFFKQNKYVDNPFGKDFIKLEVDLDNFSTNKTSMVNIREQKYKTVKSKTTKSANPSSGMERQRQSETAI